MTWGRVGSDGNSGSISSVKCCFLNVPYPLPSFTAFSASPNPKNDQTETRERGAEPEGTVVTTLSVPEAAANRETRRVAGTAKNLPVIFRKPEHSRVILGHNEHGLLGS